MRLLNQLTAEELARYQKIEEVLATGGNMTVPRDVKDSPECDGEITRRLVRPMVRPYISMFVDGREADVGYLDRCLRVETYRRATRLIMALEAWKLERGRLPKSLDDLKGKYLEQLPVVPYTGHAFRYEPSGLPDFVVWSTNYSAIKTLEPGRPFLACWTWDPSPWSGSTYGAATEDNLGSREGYHGSPRTERWKGIWVFPIP